MCRERSSSRLSAQIHDVNPHFLQFPHPCIFWKIFFMSSTCHRPVASMKLWRSTDADIQGYIIRIDRCHRLLMTLKNLNRRHGPRGMKLRAKWCHRCHQSPAGFWSGYILLSELRFWGDFDCFARFNSILAYFWGFWVIWHIFMCRERSSSLSRPVFKAIFKVRLLVLNRFLLFLRFLSHFLLFSPILSPKCKGRLFVYLVYNWWHWWQLVTLRRY